MSKSSKPNAQEQADLDWAEAHFGSELDLEWVLDREYPERLRGPTAERARLLS